MNSFVRRFVAGKNAEEAIEAVRALNQSGIKATLDFLDEECRSKEQAEASVAEYHNLFKLLSEKGVDSNASVKLTQIGLNLDPKLAADNLSRILEAADRFNNFLRVDMEGSVYTQKTLDLFHEAFRGHKNVGIVIQAYLRRSQDDIEKLISAGARVRLCKGAYKESPEAAFQSKAEINENYDRLADALIVRGHYPGLATHDDARIDRAVAAARAKGVDAQRFEFQMLYGVRPKRWKEIVSQGFNLRIYVPYGTHWFPYYYRRIRERKENLIFAARSLLGI